MNARSKAGGLGVVLRGAVLRWIPGAAVALIAVGALYQWGGTQADLRALTMPGRAVAVGDAALHLHCVGSGSPTVVLEAGATGFAQTWAWVQAELAGDTRVCAYDRAGMGWSTETAGAVDGGAAADRLRALLDAAGERPPYVLAGHSMGGPLVTTFAARNPDRVAGLVLVDPSHPDQLDHFPADMARSQANFVAMVGWAGRLAHVGVLRATNLLGRTAADLPAEDYRAARLFASSPRHLRTSHRELQAWDATMDAARAAGLPGDVPLRVLSATVGMGDMPAGFLDVNHALHRDLTGLSTRSRHVTVDGADHFSILMDREYARETARQIREVVREAGS